MGALSLVSVLVLPLSVCGARLLHVCTWEGRRASLLAGGATPVAVVVVTALLESPPLLGEGPFMFSHCEPPNLYG